jgi:hypothetical protein
MSIQANLKAQLPFTGSFVGLEVYPTGKIMEVQNNAMAFSCRGPQHNFIINVTWLAEDIDKVDVQEVRKKVREIVKATQSGQDEVETTYGNYGISSPLSDLKRLLNGRCRPSDW